MEAPFESLVPEGQNLGWEEAQVMLASDPMKAERFHVASTAYWIVGTFAGLRVSLHRFGRRKKWRSPPAAGGVKYLGRERRMPFLVILRSRVSV